MVDPELFLTAVWFIVGAGFAIFILDLARLGRHDRKPERESTKRMRAHSRHFPEGQKNGRGRGYK